MADNWTPINKADNWTPLRDVNVGPAPKRNALAAGLSSGVDDLQGLGYSGIGAVADAVGAKGVRDWANEQADRNQYESQINGRPDLERIEDQTPGTFLPYLGYQVAKQAPNIVGAVGAGLMVPEVAVPAALARGLAVGPRALGMGGMAGRVAAATAEGGSTFAARRAALEAGQTFGKQIVGGGAFNYGQSVGSLYQESVDGGDPDSGVKSLIGGVPYALAETLPEAMLVGRIGHGSGFKGNIASRMGKAAASQGATGATSELLQNEMEMAYNGSVTDDQAFSKRLNSGVAGGLVEGLLGGLGGVRKHGPARQSLEQQGTADLLNQQRGLQIGFNPIAGEPPVVFPDGTVALASDVGEYRARLAAEGHPGIAPNPDDFGQGMPDITIAPPGSGLLQPTMTSGDPALAPQPATQTPKVLQQVLEANQQAQQQREAEAAPPPLTPEQQGAQARVAQIKQAAVEAAQQVQERNKRAADFGITKPAVLTVYGELERAHTDGLVDDDQFGKMVGRLVGGQAQNTETNAVRRELVDRRKLAEAKVEQDKAVKLSDEEQVRDVFAKVQKPGKAAPAASPASQALVTQPGNTVAGIDANKKTTVGRAGREVTVTPAQLLAKIVAAPALDKLRIMAVTGMDVTTDPTTGSPRLVQVGNPMTFDQVADEEAKQTGKKVSRQAISQALKKYGIDENVATRMTAQDAPAEVSNDELGISPENNGSGFRVEGELSKATGQGLVDDGNAPTKAQRELSAQADDLLKNASPTTAVAKVPASKPGTVVTDVRDQNAALVQQNIQAAMEHPEAKNAEADWGSELVLWDKLPDTLKADWINAYLERLNASEGELTQKDFRLLDAEQVNIENDYADITKNAGREAAPTQPGVSTDVQQVAGLDGQEAQPRLADETERADPSTGTGTYNGDTGERTGDAPKPVVVVKKKRTVEKPAAQMSVDQEGSGSTVARVLTEIAKLKLNLRADKITVVQSLAELPKFIQRSVEDANPQAFVLGGRAYLIADNIKPGNARAVFMHEVGSHLGLENLLTAKEFNRLASKITEWADRNDDSQESKLARLSIGRVGAAQTDTSQVQNEQIAYFIEEAVKAGIDPTAVQYKSELGRWMATVKQAIMAALAKLNLVNAQGLTAQDIVDLAYGAAHLALQADNRADGVAQMSVAELSEAAPKFSIAADMPASARQAQTAVGNVFKQAVTQGKLWMAMTDDLARMASKIVPAVTKYMDLMRSAQVAKTAAERKVEQVLDMYAAIPKHEQGMGPMSANKFLQDSTTDKKWGYKPAYHADAVVDPAMEQRFKRLSPASQQLIQAVFQHGHDNLQAMKAAVMDNIHTDFDALIAEAERAGDTEQAAKERAAKVKALTDFTSLNNLKGNWPYAPLKRFGNHVVVGMSKEYLAAEKAGNTKLTNELKLKAEHYHVAFVETQGARNSLAEQLQAQARQFSKADGGLTQAFSKDDASEQLYSGKDALGMFRRMRTLVANSEDEHLSGKSAAALRGLMTDLHLMLLSESSARQSERQRLNIAGADGDMMRAFATQGRATAHFIANMQNSGKVYDALSEMKDQTDARVDEPGNTRTERREYYNELMKRHAMGLDYDPSPFVNKALGFSSLWHLMVSPAYYLTNMTQPFVMSLPVMAGKHGYGKSAAALTRAYRELMPLLKKGKLSEADYAKLPADIRVAVGLLVDQGHINISQEQDLGRWRSEDNSKFKYLGNVIDKMREVSQSVEAINRLTTAMASLRLEAAAGVSLDRQVANTGRLIDETHGNYSGFNAPRIMRTPVGRLLTQFRKFQLIQVSLFTRMIHDSFKGASPEERTVARAALGYSLGHMFALGGLLGMPGAQVIGFILRHSIGDGDEPDNPELTLRKLIGDETVANLLVKGLPKMLGVDVSGRVGAGGMLSLAPYADLDMSKKGAEGLIVQAAGPFVGGMLPKFAQGLGMISQGQLWKGLEQLMPTGMDNISKTIRMQNQGMTMSNGDVVMKPEDISFLDATMQVLGLPTNTLTDRQFQSNTAFESDKFFKEKANQIKSNYVAAHRAGDGEAAADARQAWAELQDARKRNGYDKQGLGELMKAPQAQVKREKNVIGGVQYRAGSKGNREQTDEVS